MAALERPTSTPNMPGATLTRELPYFFDEVFCLDILQGPEGQQFRALRTKTDLQYECKDRSGALDDLEEPHLGKAIKKILAATNTGE